MQHHSRLYGGLSLLAALTLLASPPPAASPVLAQGSQVNRTVAASLANDLQQFSTGTQQRTGLSTIKGAGPSDLGGAVQLLPSGEITEWSDAGSELLAPTAEHAATYLEYATAGSVKKGRIFVLGGRAGTSDPQIVKTVLSAEVQQELIYSGTAIIDKRGELVIPPGQTSAWRSEPDLPVQADNANPDVDVDDNGDPDTIGEAPERANIAAVAISKPGGGGYLYAIGGLYHETLGLTGRSDLISSPEVSIASVSNQGQITAWRNGRKLNIGEPTAFEDDVPLRSASAFAMTAQNGKTYIFVVGGVNQRFNGGQIELIGSDQVLRSEVDLATGDLGAWQQVATIPVRVDQGAPNDTTVGVWDSGVAYVHFLTENGGAKDAFLVIGGQGRVERSGVDAQPALFLSEAYQGMINESGDVVFDPLTDDAGSLVSDFAQHTIATYNGAIYMLGGTEGGLADPTSAVQGSYLEELDGMPRLAKPGPIGSTNNFLRNDNLGPNKRRAAHATVVVPAGETRAYVYVIGGRGQNTAGERDVFFGIIGGDQTASRFVPNGWYYSQAYDLVKLARDQGYNIESGNLKNLIWDSTLTQTLGHDIRLEYRISNGTTMEPTAEWIPITATLAADGKGSVDGETSQGGINANRTALDNQVARLIQFRALLISANGEGTPLLRRVALEFDITGTPNLKFPESPFTKLVTTVDGKPTLDGIAVKIANKDTAEPPLLDARFSDDLTQFYVELYINPTTKPPTFGTKGVAFAIVDAIDMPADYVGEIKKWCDPATSTGSKCDPIAITGLMTQPGSYEVYAYVDQLWPNEAQQSTFGLIPETALEPSAPNEQDNVTTEPLIITIAPPDQVPTTPPASCATNPNLPECVVAPDPDPVKPAICPDPNDRFDPTCEPNTTPPDTGWDGDLALPIVMKRAPS